MPEPETYRPAFTDPPGTNLAGIPISSLQLPTPYLSYGLSYDEACVKHDRYVGFQLLFVDWENLNFGDFHLSLPAERIWGCLTRHARLH